MEAERKENLEMKGTLTLWKNGSDGEDQRGKEHPERNRQNRRDKLLLNLLKSHLEVKPKVSSFYLCSLKLLNSSTSESKLLKSAITYPPYQIALRG